MEILKPNCLTLQFAKLLILSDFAMRKTSYATYLIEEIPGNRGLHGNACSEQNKWSVISHLNPGVAKGDKTYCEHPITLIKY